MKTEIRVAVAAALTLVAPQIAAAADAPGTVSAPDLASIEAQDAAWSGFYAGFGFGVTNGSDSVDIFNQAGKGGEVLAGTVDGKPQGAFGAAELGYDLQVGPIVAGVGANYDFAVGDKSSVDNSVSPTELRQSLGDSWGVGARLGYLVTNDLLLFASLGYGGQRLTIDAVDTGSPGTAVSNSYDLAGLYLGAGVEIRLTESLSVKAEYRYADYRDSLTTDAFGATDQWYATTGAVRADQLRALLAWRF